jgi:AcrR family transcriptional regulator
MNKALETKNLIIEKAAPIFNKHGYAGTSMSQLAQAIQMTKGAIYGNFKDKDEIALAAFDYNFSLFRKRIEKAVRLKDNACDKLIAMAGQYLDGFPELSVGGGCPILNAAVDSDNVHDGLKERVRQALDSWMEAVVKIINRGIKEKQVQANTRPEQFASVFVSLIEGGVMLAKATGKTIHLSRNIDHIIHLVNVELRRET